LSSSPHLSSSQHASLTASVTKSAPLTQVFLAEDDMDVILSVFLTQAFSAQQDALVGLSQVLGLPMPMPDVEGESQLLRLPWLCADLVEEGERITLGLN
jgi:hypothetical protein